MAPAADFPAAEEADAAARTVEPGRVAWRVSALALLFATLLLALGVPRIIAWATEAERLRAATVRTDALLAALLDAETGQRGYLLTGQDPYLVPYERAEAMLDPAVAAVEESLALRPIHGALRPVLRDMLDATAEKRRELAITIGAFRDSGADAAVARVLAGDGKAAMDRVRAAAAAAHRIADERAALESGKARRLLIGGGAAAGALLCIAFAAGLSARRTVRAAEAEADARIRAIYDTAPLGIAMLDPQLRFLVANGALADIAGHPGADPQGRPLAQFMPAALAPGLAALLRGALKRPGTLVDTVLDDDAATTPRRSWLAMARADREPDAPPTLILLLQDITERRRAEAERAMLVHELQHRVKNVIATVQGIASQSWEGTRNAAFIDVFGDRLRSLARAHGLLTEAAWTSAPMDAVIAVALAPWQGEGGGGIVIAPHEGEMPLLSPTQVLSLNYALHELATNAAKYGALSVPGGTVAIDWHRQSGGRVALRWVERGGPPVEAPPTHEGFGTYLVGTAFSGDSIPGEVTRSFTRDGLEATLQFTPEGA
jgi:PAS domain S-box-containing protein